MFNKNNIKNVISNLGKGNVLVIGDFAIDEMVYGSSHRISREAPVLILKHSNTDILLGAASNAANNIAALGSKKVYALGVCGEDYYKNLLLEALTKANIDTSTMISDISRVTTTKTRISGASEQSVTQQIVRIDREFTQDVTAELEKKIINKLHENVKNIDAIVLSDYGIGVITQNIIDESIKLAKENNIFCVVDAQKDLYRFKGATVMTPNQPDAEKTLGYKIDSEETLMKAGNEFIEKTNCEMVLITRGSNGMVLFEKNGTVTNIPAFNKRRVFDVTGAGDTVVASFTAALCAGAKPSEAIVVGNLAASIVIRQFGAAITSQKELIEHLDNLNLAELI